MNNKHKTEKKLTGGVVTIIVLIFCLCITSFAIVYATVDVDNNVFKTGWVKINLNDSKPIINDNDLLFEPGMTVCRDFFIENLSTDPEGVYYKLYFSGITGGLADVLEVTITSKAAATDGAGYVPLSELSPADVYYSGKVTELERDMVDAVPRKLGDKEKLELVIYFRFPPECGNEAENLTLSFDLCAEAVQSRNNPNKLFD